MEKRKILIVDDEIDFLQLLKARLIANDYDVVTAMDGKEAIDKFKSERPVALIVDIMLPEVNGLEVLKAVRQQDRSVPIFVITAFSNEERFSIANQYNASGFIMKTSDLQTEIKKITAIIDIAEKHKK